MEEILFSGAGGSAYTKKSSTTGGNVQPKEGGKGRVTPPSTRVRVQTQPVEPTEPRRRRSRLPQPNPVEVAQPTDGGEGQQNAGVFNRRTTSRRGLAGRSGRRLRRSE